MLTSLALIFLVGMSLGWVFGKMQLPRLLGMLLTGILLGPYAFGVLDSTILSISAELRRLALIIILTRAGLALDVKALRKVGRPAILMCFLPACFEIGGMVLLAPKLLGVSILDAAIMGAVLAAVSPAVVVPKMLYLLDAGYGAQKNIPQLIMAAASVDDVFVIVLFTTFVGLSQGAQISPSSFAQIPVAIVTGLGMGLTLGIGLASFFRRVHMRDSAKVMIVLSTGFLLVAAEQSLEGLCPFSGLLAVMGLGAAMQKKRPEVANRLSIKFSKLWVAAEVLLFVLVGATVDIAYAAKAGVAAVLLIFAVLLFRMAGVFCCLIRTSLSAKERVFCMIAYIPKATVQAAIGSIPLSMGLPCGQIVLTVAVLAIIITAPLGAWLIDRSHRRLLCNSETKTETGLQPDATKL